MSIESNDQGNVEQRIVEAVAVGPHPPLAEVFAMIRGDQHDGVPKVASALELVEQATQLLIQVGQLGIIEVAGIRILPVADKTLAELRKRVIRIVGSLPSISRLLEIKYGT